MLKRYVCVLMSFCIVVCMSSCAFLPSNQEHEHTAESVVQTTRNPEPEPAAELVEELSCLRIRAVGTEVPVGFSGYVTHLWLWDVICDGLLYMEPDNPDEIKGCLAESWSHSEDHLTWIFSIRENIFFSDGTPCDAYAVCQFLDIHEGRYSYCNLARWYASSAYELVMKLSEPCPWFETELCQGAFRIVSPTAIALYGLSDSRSAVGTGPYSISDYKFEIEKSQMWIEFAANKNYHMEERYPAFDVLHLDVDNTETLEGGRSYEKLGRMLTDGELDVVMFSSSQYGIAEELCVEGRHELYSYLAKGMHGNALWFNPTVSEPLMNKTVRQAICTMVDPESINFDLYGGLGRVNNSIWADNSVSAVPYDGYYCDIEEGLQLLADAGYTPEELTVTVGGITNKPILEQISTQLSRCGVQTEVYIYNGAAGATYVNNSSALNLPIYVGHDYGPMGLGVSWGNGPHALWMKVMVSRENDRSDGFNTGGYKFSWQEIYAPELYAQMGDLYDRMITTPHWDEMIECSRELTRIVQEDYAALPLVQEPVFFAVREGSEELFEALTRTSMFKWMYQ